MMSTYSIVEGRTCHLCTLDLHVLLQEFQNYKLLIYGALLVFMMLKRPEGLVPTARRTRELHQEEYLQDAWLGDDDSEQQEEAGERL